MKFLLLLLLITPAFGQSIEDRVKKFDSPKSYKVEYDKFRQVTTVTTELDFKPRRKGYSYVLLSLSSSEITVGMIFSAPFGSIYNRPALRWLLNGSDLVEIESRDIDDVVAFLVPVPQFKKIAVAKTAEMQLPFFEGKLDDKSLIKLRNLASLAN